jgi:hypothetical protein
MKRSSRFVSTDTELVQKLVAEINSQRPRLQKKRSEMKTTEAAPDVWRHLAPRLNVKSTMAASRLSGLVASAGQYQSLALSGLSRSCDR